MHLNLEVSRHVCTYPSKDMFEYALFKCLITFIVAHVCFFLEKASSHKIMGPTTLRDDCASMRLHACCYMLHGDLQICHHSQS